MGFLPLPCQHCDAAPCEPVCPVFAAVHNDQGLNAQDLQPVHRHPVLLEQLPLQGPAVQLVRPDTGASRCTCN